MAGRGRENIWSNGSCWDWGGINSSANPARTSPDRTSDDGVCQEECGQIHSCQGSGRNKYTGDARRTPHSKPRPFLTSHLGSFIRKRLKISSGNGNQAVYNASRNSDRYPSISISKTYHGDIGVGAINLFWVYLKLMDHIPGPNIAGVCTSALIGTRHY
jgi:hypothetical protein